MGNGKKGQTILPYFGERKTNAPPVRYAYIRIVKKALYKLNILSLES